MSESWTAIKLIQLILVVIVLILGIAGIYLAYFGLPGTLDAEPVLGIGLILIALAGLLSFLKKD